MEGRSPEIGETPDREDTKRQRRMAAVDGQGDGELEIGEFETETCEAGRMVGGGRSSKSATRGNVSTNVLNKQEGIFTGVNCAGGCVAPDYPR
jgi:hypothetical protein